MAFSESDTRAKLIDPALELLDFTPYAVGFDVYAPVRLILFPEVFLQGWCSKKAPATLRMIWTNPETKEDIQ